jgi:D-glycero-alpha-D-manno-heptose-7-phosphate kinase
VRARAPLRLGLAGGGTDVAPYCEEHGGAILNITIQRYAYAFVTERKDDQVCFRSSDLDVTELEGASPQVDDSGPTALLRGVYNRIVRQFRNGCPLPVTITTQADAPPGSGLGTSSAIVVALVDAFRAFLELPLSPYDVARLAFEIERQDLGLAGGRQDQYAAAFGGANFIEFLPGERVIVNPLRLRRGVLDELEASMVTCFTGQSRQSSRIIDEQVRRVTSGQDDVVAAMHQLKADALDMKIALLRGDIGGMANVLRRSWEAKKRTASAISNADIDQLFEFALDQGALAGKVSGAGGGGFVMLLATPEARPALLRSLRARGMAAEAVQFTDKGCETWTP